MIIGCAAVAYDVINGIVQASKEYVGGFSVFICYITNAVMHATKYLLYTVIAVGVNKVVNK